VQPTNLDRKRNVTTGLRMELEQIQSCRSCSTRFDIRRFPHRNTMVAGANMPPRGIRMRGRSIWGSKPSLLTIVHCQAHIQTLTYTSNVDVQAKHTSAVDNITASSNNPQQHLASKPDVHEWYPTIHTRRRKFPQICTLLHPHPPQSHRPPPATPPEKSRSSSKFLRTRLR
jgi:hypothetical protein